MPKINFTFFLSPACCSTVSAICISSKHTNFPAISLVKKNICRVSANPPLLFLLRSPSNFQTFIISSKPRKKFHLCLYLHFLFFSFLFMLPLWWQQINRIPEFRGAWRAHRSCFIKEGREWAEPIPINGPSLLFLIVFFTKITIAAITISIITAMIWTDVILFADLPTRGTPAIARRFPL